MDKLDSIENMEYFFEGFIGVDIINKRWTT